MPLTRHLYREDEVVAALIFCILRARHVEACFWTMEMLDSGMVNELSAALRRAWFYGVGIRSLGWLRDFRSAMDEDIIDSDMILRLVVELARAPKDRSIVSLLGSELADQPDRVNCGSLPQGFSRLESFIALAIQQRRTLTAWGGLHGVDDPDTLLRGAAIFKHGAAGRSCLVMLDGEDFSARERRAITVAALCLSKEEFETSWARGVAPTLLIEVERELIDWSANLGRRARRAYAIPSSCLYYFTERGRILSPYDTNEKEIMGRLEKPGALWGSVFWDEVADWAAVRGDDDAREAFYEGHFPDDCPDEWSKAERAKSHGAGPLQRGAVAETGRALQGLIGNFPSAVIWGELPTIKNEEWDIEKPVDISDWNLVPVVKRRLLQ